MPRLRDLPQWDAAATEALAARRDLYREIVHVGRLDAAAVMAFHLGPLAPSDPRAPWLTPAILEDLACDCHEYLALKARFALPRRDPPRAVLRRQLGGLLALAQEQIFEVLDLIAELDRLHHGARHRHVDRTLRELLLALQRVRLDASELLDWHAFDHDAATNGGAR